MRILHRRSRDSNLPREHADTPADLVGPYQVPRRSRSRGSALRIAIVANSEDSSDPDPKESREFRGSLTSMCGFWLHLRYCCTSTICMDAEPAAETPITTGEVARLIGVCKTTLLRWIRVGFLPEPPFVQIGRVRVRMWGKADLMRALQHRASYYNWTRNQIDESERRAKRMPGNGSD